MTHRTAARTRLLLSLAGFMLSACARSGPHYSGTVQTEFSQVGSQLGGRVVAVYVQAGSRVHRGEVLVRLDPAILQAELDQARGQAAQSAAYLAEQRNGAIQTDITRAQESSNAAHATYEQSMTGASTRIAAARASVETAQADERLQKVTYERMRALAQTGDVSRATYDQAHSSFDQARARTVAAIAQYEQLVKSDLPGEQASSRGNARSAHAGYRTLANGTRPEVIAQAYAQDRNARASVARAQARLAEMVIYSPVDGIVSSFSLHRGDMLGANQTAAIIDAAGDPYAYTYVSQRDIERIRTAKHLTVRADSGSGTFDGHVESYDRSAQFTPQNVETADQRAELVYGMKVRIHDPRRMLLDGTTVTVEVP
jgi:HlyD family secretion protein